MMKIPMMGQPARKRTERAPILKNPKKSESQAAPKLPNWNISTKPKTWDIGDGPWTVNGQPASRPEYITWLVLKRLGWNPKFQTNIAGGRRLPGGQVLDLLIEETSPAVYISVKGYYHEGAEMAYKDKVKELTAKSMLNGAKVLEVWEKDIDAPGWLESYLRREVGIRGR